MSRKLQAAPEFSGLDRYAVSPVTGRRRVPAWLASCLLHASVFLTIALLAPLHHPGLTTEPLRSAGIVLAHATTGQVEYFSESDEEPSASASLSTPAAMPAVEDGAAGLLAPLPTSADLPIDLTGVLPSGAELAGQAAGQDLAKSLPHAADLAKKSRPPMKIGHATHTYVFGAEGEGSSFVYVFDRSDSMNEYGGRPLAAAKAELLRSVKKLQSIHQFQIIFYNGQISVFNPLAPQPPRVVFADDKTKAMAEQYVRQIVAFDGTRHMEPLRLALRLAPDVIFFLTDAADPVLTRAELAELERLNGGTVIHAIEFGSGPFPGGDNFLIRLARQTGGQHVYVDVSQLPE